MTGKGSMIDLNPAGALSEIASETMQRSHAAVPAAQVSGTSSNTCPSAMEVAIAYRLRTEHLGMAAESLGEAGNPLKNGSLVSCACCGKPETKKKTLICDACGKSFHLKCLKLRESQVSALDQWTCMQCLGKKEKHDWALGRINIKQETSSVTEHIEGGVGQEQATVGSGGVAQVATDIGPVLEIEKLKSQKKGRDDDADASVGTMSNGLEEPRQRITRLKTLCRAKEDTSAGTQIARADGMEPVSAEEKESSQYTSATAFSKYIDDEIEALSKETDAGKLGQQHLQRLKEFIGQQGGLLDDEWTVSVKKRPNSEKTFDVIYFSPDKQKFRSKLEVARFLGIYDQGKSEAASPEPYKGRKRKEPVEEAGPQSDERLLEQTKRTRMGGNDNFDSQGPVFDSFLGVPLQYMDLSVEALGVVDARPGYYDDQLVWPVGYRCVWHDGVTGSVCISEIIDGGASPPIFRITRKSCFTSTDLHKNGECHNKEENEQDQVSQEAVKRDVNGGLGVSHMYDEDDELSMLQGTLTSFMHGELGQSQGVTEDWDGKDGIFDIDQSRTEVVDWHALKEGALHRKLDEASRGSQGEVDIIGDIIVESSSSQGAWRLFAEQVLNRVRDLFSKGSLHLGCQHAESSLISALGLNISTSIEVSAQIRQSDAHMFFTRLYQWVGQDRFGLNIPVVQKYLAAKRAELQCIRFPPPSGRPIFQKVSSDFVGDLLQIWEFLCRFSDILGQKEPPSLEELEEMVADVSDREHEKAQNKRTASNRPSNQSSLDVAKVGSSEAQNLEGREICSMSHIEKGSMGPKRLVMRKGSSACCSVALSMSNIALLKIALSDLRHMASGGASDLTFDTKRGKKKEGEPVVAAKKQGPSSMPLNELTWPEVARRYVIGLLTLNTCGENFDISVQDRRKILRCIQGDGGVLCGALDGVAAIEADAQLLAAAEKQLSQRLLGVDPKPSSEPSYKARAGNKPIYDIPADGVSRKPAWALVLEPVRKLATNVGARIRNCIREALEMNPPDWARETLEWSISKEVYKGNASGPTKRAVLSVLEKVAEEKQPVVSAPKVVEKKVEYIVPSPALVMKRCRIILRQLVGPDDVRVFCNALGGTVLGYFEDEEDNLEVPLPLVARPLDFRMIDCRLAAGAYGDAHESFAADMRQLFRNVPDVFAKRDDMVKVGQEMWQQFEKLYEEKVIKLVSGKEEAAVARDNNNQGHAPIATSAATQPKDVCLPTGLEDLAKAPWEEGVCKICGVDKDDDSTLLCDGCDAEYHIYCLDPPLSMIPEGNWYCPSCVAREQGGSVHVPVAEELSRTVFKQVHQSRLSEDGKILSSLVAGMTGKDYWQLSASKRVQLLKFLCDKVLESASIRDHIDQSIELLPELQQKLRLLLIERQNCVMKGSHRLDDIPAADINTETASKDLLPRKRGRKTSKPVTSSLVDESSRSQSGLELLRRPGDNAHNYELDGGIMDGRSLDRFFQMESDVAGEIHGLCSDFQTPKGQSIQEVQLRSRPAEDSSRHKNMPQLIGLHVEQNMLDASYSHVFSQNQNGSAEAQGVLDSGFLGSTQGNFVGLHPLCTPPANICNGSVDFGTREQQNGVSSVLQSWSLEGGIDKSLTPQLSSQSYPGNGHEATSLATVEEVPGKTALELLEAEIEKVETEMMKMAPRRESLGRDDLGRSYWALGWAGKYPWLVVEARSPSECTDKSGAGNGNVNMASSGRGMKSGSTGLNTLHTHVSIRGQCGMQEWSAYYGDDCLDQLLKWLRPTSSIEMSLKSALTKWCLIWSSRYKKEPDKHTIGKSMSIPLVSVNTKAATILSKLFGSIPQPDGPSDGQRKRGRKKKSLGEGKIFRCDCLELVWTGRIHCPLCHHTYESVAELQVHNHGSCSWRGFDDEGQALVLSKAKKGKIKGQEFHAPDLSLVIKRFTVHTMNHTRVLEIGCLADKGPRFVPALSSSPLLDSSLHMTTILSPVLHSEISKGDISVSNAAESSLEGSRQEDSFAKGHNISDNAGKESDQGEIALRSETSEEISMGANMGGLMDSFPPSQPLLETNSWTFKKLKASLLDIESLLSADIMEPSRSEPKRRRAWRSFVKSASSILELVHSLVLLEHMVRASSLREAWCQWNSVSAGVGINTLCSLALRIYSLDAAIKYKRSSVEIDTEDSGKLSKPGRKKKVLETA